MLLDIYIHVYDEVYLQTLYMRVQHHAQYIPASKSGGAEVVSQDKLSRGWGRESTVKLCRTPPARFSRQRNTTSILTMRMRKAIHQHVAGLSEDTHSDGSEDEESLETEPCPCLFYKAQQPSAMATLDHCRTQHNVDLLSIATRLGRPDTPLHTHTHTHTQRVLS